MLCRLEEFSAKDIKALTPGRQNLAVLKCESHRTEVKINIPQKGRTIRRKGSVHT